MAIVAHQSSISQSSITVFFTVVHQPSVILRRSPSLSSIAAVHQCGPSRASERMSHPRLSNIECVGGAGNMACCRTGPDPGGGPDPGLHPIRPRAYQDQWREEPAGGQQPFSAAEYGLTHAYNSESSGIYASTKPRELSTQIDRKQIRSSTAHFWALAGDRHQLTTPY